MDLVDVAAVRRLDAVLRRPPPQLCGVFDPARVHHAIRAVVPDHAGPVHVPHVRRAHLHGPLARVRARVSRRQAAAPRQAAARGGAPGDRGALLRLLLSGLDRGTDLELGVVRQPRHAAVGTEDVAAQLSRPAAVAAADLLLELAVAGFFLACAVAGFGITYLSGTALTLEERVVCGSVLGAMAVTATTFVASMFFRDVNLTTVAIGLFAALALAAAGAVGGRGQIVADAADARARWFTSMRTPGHPWPLLAVFVVCG